MRSGRAIPPRLLEAPPEVNPGLELFMAAFWDLCSDRFMEGHRIPWTAINSWCDAHGIDKEDRQDFHHLVGRLDMTFLQWLQKKQKKPNKQPEALKKPNDARPVR